MLNEKKKNDFRWIKVEENFGYGRVYRFSKKEETAR
jgi:hypothetical protein